MSDMTNEKMFKVLREEGRQYRQKIKSLQELLDSQIKANCSIANKLVECEQSRNELLGALKQISDKDCFDPPTIDRLIRDAENLKKKEKHG